MGANDSFDVERMMAVIRLMQISVQDSVHVRE